MVVLFEDVVVGEVPIGLAISLAVCTLKENNGEEVLYGGPLCCCLGGIADPVWVG